MSYMSAPKLHQSTALPWPLLVRISGALQGNNNHTVNMYLTESYALFYIWYVQGSSRFLTANKVRSVKYYFRFKSNYMYWYLTSIKWYIWLTSLNVFFNLNKPRKSSTYIYSIVPQNVWVNPPSLIDSLHNPKSVSFTCPINHYQIDTIKFCIGIIFCQSSIKNS